MKLKSQIIFRAVGLYPVFLCELVLILMLVSPSLAQTNKKSSESKSETPAINISLPQNQMGYNKALLDKKIDPDKYVLGPGDILSIFVWGGYEGQFTLPITPEGMVLVPELGPIDVAGLTLTDARQKISVSISEKFRNVSSTVSLVDLRVFKVFIGGAVVNPGAYPATAVTRLSEVITMAGGLFENFETGDKKQPPSYQYAYSWNRASSKRNITVTRQNGQVIKGDILRLDLSGNSNFDPQLSDGDQIFVPIRESMINLYGIFGAVRNPGYFEYSERDSLADLLALAHGTASNADSHSVEIVRFNSDTKSTFSLIMDLTSASWNIPLHSDDRVYIKPIQGYHEKYQVELVGEFVHPGFYAITEDSTTLYDIVQKAGGLTNLASLEEAEMARMSAEELVDPEFERLKKMEIADMSESEYEYFKIKSRSKVGRVAVDFDGLFGKNDLSKNVPLRNSDVITVPRKRQVITVSGEVANPGFQTYVPGKDFAYYISAAGGYSDQAGRSKVSIIKTATGEWKKAKKGKGLEPGDTVWIPEKKKHNYIALAKDVAVFIGNLATIYLVIQQATQ
jgi:polysaccharide biosynthesis/export protein